MTDENKPSAVDDAADIMSKYEKNPEFEHAVKDNWLVYWWKRVWYEEYHLTIYFVANKTVDERGRETYTRTPKKYKAERIYTLKPHIIKFKDDNDQIIEIKSAEISSLVSFSRVSNWIIFFNSINNLSFDNFDTPSIFIFNFLMSSKLCGFLE